MIHLSDELVEKFLKLYWEITKLDEIHDDIDVEEWVKRCFKGFEISVDISNNHINLRSFGISGNVFNQLSTFLRDNNLTMEIGNPKDYYEVYLSIYSNKLLNKERETK